MIEVRPTVSADRVYKNHPQKMDDPDRLRAAATIRSRGYPASAEPHGPWHEEKEKTPPDPTANPTMPFAGCALSTRCAG